MATASGVKDKYATFFFDKLAAACGEYKDAQAHGTKPKGPQALQDFLRDLRLTMPEDIFNPILRMNGIDPNSDTPVEILHVILLGFVKYFWRDAVSRLNASNKQLLKTRLASLDVRGLGLSRLRAHTLVQYAGSLNGGDFRIVLQVAPAALQGLVSDSHYECWLTLCRLAPMVFQPSIANMEKYLVRCLPCCKYQ